MKKIILAACFCALAFGTLEAQQQEAQHQPAQNSPVATLMNWFGRLEQSLSASSVGQDYENRDDVVAVAAVRGSKQNLADPNQPAWKKSNVSKKEKSLRERKELALAVQKIIAGHLNQAQKDLASFEKSHPKSLLLGDVHQAQTKIAELQKLKAKSRKKTTSKKKRSSKSKVAVPEAQTDQANP